MAEPTLLRNEDKALAALTRAIYLGKTAEALALIAPGLAFERIARGVNHTPLGDGAMEQASRLLSRLQDELVAQGFTLAFANAIPEAGRMPLILLPTADKYAALLASGTNGINYGHDAEAVVRWLKDMERENPFHLGGCGHDFLHDRFAGPVQNTEALAARMITFCPDIADQADASLRAMSRDEQARAIAAEMERSGWFGFWWD